MSVSVTSNSFLRYVQPEISTNIFGAITNEHPVASMRFSQQHADGQGRLPNLKPGKNWETILTSPDPPTLGSDVTRVGVGQL